MNYQFKRVDSGIYRGPRPTLADLADLKAFGIRSIMNLENDSTVTDAEFNECERLQIFNSRVAMSEWTRPQLLDLFAAVLIIKAPEKQPILVHCKHGQDRTGYVIAAYRMLVQHWSREKAYRELVSNGHKWFWYLLWQKSLTELEVLCEKIAHRS